MTSTTYTQMQERQSRRGALWRGRALRRGRVLPVAVVVVATLSLIASMIVPGSQGWTLRATAAAASPVSGITDVPTVEHVAGGAPQAPAMPSHAPAVVPEVAAGVASVAGDGKATAMVGGTSLSVRTLLPESATTGLTGAERAQLVAAPVAVATTRLPSGGIGVRVTPSASRSSRGSQPWRGTVTLSDPALLALGGPVLDRLVARNVETGGCAPVVVDHATGLVSVTATVAAGSAVYALDGGVKSDKGDYSSTAPAPGSTWSAGSNSGSFGWNMPIPVPQTPGGLSPSLAVSYDTGRVDGLKASTNNQPSWVGEGFALTSGSIQRSYRSCNDDPGLNQPNVANPATLSGDLCWVGEHLTITLNGKTSRLIKDSSGFYRLADDDGSLIQQISGELMGSDNGARSGEWFLLKARNGTYYYFGITKRFPEESSSTHLQSTEWAPVFGNNAGEPCYTGTMSTSWCNQGVKWNLAYVLDPMGNSMTYQYQHEYNWYKSASAGGTSLKYVRSSYLKNIFYGQRYKQEQVGSVEAPATVTFGVAERCLPTQGTTCSDAEYTVANQKYWPDVPVNLSCSSSCTDAQSAPAFFTRKRLAQIVTSVKSGGVSKDVRKWAFAHSFPALDTGYASLWLDKITESSTYSTSATPGPELTLPATTFRGRALPNRIAGTESPPSFLHYRVDSITTSQGAVINVTWAPVQCIAGGTMPSMSNLANNTLPCYPDQFTPLGMLEPDTFFFHKYLTSQVTVSPGSGKAQQVYNYSYENAGWHYDENFYQPDKNRTWSAWRGYGAVTASIGGADEPNKLTTKTSYYRGLNQDRNTPSGNKTATVTDSYGASRADENWFAGWAAETRTFAGSALVSSTVSVPWASPATAVDAYSAARVVKEGVATRHTPRVGGAELVGVTSNSYDPATGRITSSETTATGTEATCTVTGYVPNGARVRDVPQRVTTSAQPCPITVPGPLDSVLKDQRYSYDGQALGVAPTQGLVTKTEQVLDAPGGTPRWVATATTAYDALGRVTSVTDALNQATTTSYAPATGMVTSVAVTNPKLYTATTSFDAYLGKPTSVSDANGLVTSVGYDSLGRLTSVTPPARQGLSAGTTYTYTTPTSPDAARAVTATVRNARDTGVITTTTLYDGLGRIVQTQAPDASGATGRVLTRDVYDSRGLLTHSEGPWRNAGAAVGTTLAMPAATDRLDRYLDVAYDGAGRSTTRTETVGTGAAQQKWVTSWVYGGDFIETGVPSGGIATRTTTDARSRTTALWRYHTNTLPADGNAATKDVISYSYTPKGQLGSVTNQAGTTWSYNYDFAGRKVTDIDPDKGTSTTTYDDLHRPVTVTDARNITLTTSYDVLSRPVLVKNGAATVQTWAYDTATLGKGKLASSTVTVDGADYVQAVAAYDSNGLATSSSVTIPTVQAGLAGTYTRQDRYARNGAWTGTTLPAVNGLPVDTLSANYTALDQINALSYAKGALVGGGTFDAFGRVNGYSIGGYAAMKVSRSYEPGTGRLANTTVAPTGAAATSNATFSYDPAGRITSIADMGDGTTAKTDRQCFSYDWAGQLTEAWSNADAVCASTPALTNTGVAPYWASYSYDNSYRRTSKTIRGPTGTTATTLSYPGASAGRPHAPTGATINGVAASFGYDAAGNTTSGPVPAGGQAAFTWDAQGRMATATKAGASAGERLIYAPDGHLLVRVNADGSKSLFPFPDQEITAPAGAVAGTALTARRSYPFAGATVAYRTYTATTSTLTLTPPTYQGSATIQRQDTAGSVPVVQRLYPYGAVRKTEGVWQGRNAFLGNTSAAAQASAHTGLVHLGAREYNPTLGLFTSVDPVIDLQDPAQLNAYTYAHNSPVTGSDPSGTVVQGATDQRGDTLPPGARGAETYFTSGKYAYYQDQYKRDKAWTWSSAQPVGGKARSTAPATPHEDLLRGVAEGVGVGINDLREAISSLNPQALIDSARDLLRDPWRMLEVLKSGLHLDDMWGLVNAIRDSDAYQAGVYIGKLVVGVGADALAATLTAGAAKTISLIKDAVQTTKAAALAANGGNRVFWSGGPAAKEAAAEFAAANGAKTLEMTAVGRALERLPYNRVTAKLWDAASAGFAATARGEANVFIGPAFRGSESVFGRIEGPILNLKGNPILQRFEDAW